MRTYFFGDIHGNEPALDTCLAHADKLSIDEVICLGDLVGWLPFGDRSLKRMRALGLPTVAGNHDLLVAGLFMDHPGQVDRMQATAYTAGLLSTVEGALSYLSELPLQIERAGFTVAHHSPFHLPAGEMAPTIANFDYLDEAALAGCLDAWRSLSRPIIFSGHDHIPAVYELPASADPPHMEKVRIHRPEPDRALSIRLQPGARYWIKAGSVGGPYRDGVPVANSVLYDSVEGTVTLFRLPFPTAGLMQELTGHRFARNLPTLRRYIDLLRTQPSRGTGLHG